MQFLKENLRFVILSIFYFYWWTRNLADEHIFVEKLNLDYVLRRRGKSSFGICFDYSLSPHFVNPKKQHKIFFIVIDCFFYLSKNKRKCQMWNKIHIYGVNYSPPMIQFHLFFQLLPFIHTYRNWPTTPAHYHNIDR